MSTVADEQHNTIKIITHKQTLQSTHICLLKTSSIQMSTVADEQHNTIKTITHKQTLQSTHICLLNKSSIQMSTVADEQHNTIKIITHKPKITVHTYLPVKHIKHTNVNCSRRTEQHN